MKLLIVDDDVFLRDMYAIKFRESNFEVEIAETAEEAMVKLDQGMEFDAILMDMVMPGMTGVELISEIKNKYPDCKSRLVILSNQGQESDMADANKAGADGYIIKAEAIPSDVVTQVTAILKK